MVRSDESLIQQFKIPGTKDQAFESIVHQYSRVLFAHLSKYISKREDIEDVLQHVWLKVWKGLDNFRGESQLSTWLFTIATREAYTHHRSKKITTQEIYDIHTEQFSSGTNSPDEAEILSKLQEAIDILPAKQQEVFVMRYFEEMSYEDMSRKTGTSVGALKASYHYAVRKIEQFINPD